MFKNIQKFSKTILKNFQLKAFKNPPPDKKKFLLIYIPLCRQPFHRQFSKFETTDNVTLPLEYISMSGRLLLLLTPPRIVHLFLHIRAAVLNVSAHFDCARKGWLLVVLSMLFIK